MPSPPLPTSLPSPPFTIAIDLPSPANQPIDVAALPAKPGVFAIENELGHTLALSATANLRRAVVRKLQPSEAGVKPSRHIEYRAIAHWVRALRVSSGFEADWAWLQHARLRLPQTYKASMDRWQAWFVQCDPQAAFPEFTKTAHPLLRPGSTIVHIGPFPEKHAAGRYIDMLEDSFDLCRYHHVLVQSPHGSACAYKEMGRCPAPCDGTVSMDHYRSQVHEAIEFARTPLDQWRASEELEMNQASASLNFEKAQRHRQRSERTLIASRSEFAQVNRLEKFAFVAVLPGETEHLARIFLIRGGWIEPLRDLDIDAGEDQLQSLLDFILVQARPPASADLRQAADFQDAAIENIGLVCWHLFRPRSSAPVGSFLRINEQLNVDRLNNAIRSLTKPSAVADPEAPIVEHDVENLQPEPQKP